MFKKIDEIEMNEEEEELLEEGIDIEGEKAARFCREEGQHMMKT